MQTFGATKKPLILLEERLDLICKRPSFPPTGTHLSPRSASVWRSTSSRSSLLSSTSRRTPCTLWSLMGITAAPHWVVTRGIHWLVLRPTCNTTVTGKDLTPRVTVNKWIRTKQESVSFLTMKTNANHVIPGSGLVLVDIPTTPTHVRGNEALAIYEADNSDKHIKTMGYILVQWKVNNKKGNCHFWGITWFLEEQKGGSVKTLERFKGDYSNFLGQWRRWGGGGDSLKEGNGDVPLDKVAFLRLDWL